MALVTQAKNDTTADRNALILDHLDFVRHVYERTVVELPYGIDDENLLSAGTLGLIEAAGNYDTSRGVPFQSYAYWRIRGAMIDELRRNCPLPQRVLENLSVLRSAISDLPVPMNYKAVSEMTGLSKAEIDECLEASRLASPHRWTAAAGETTDRRQLSPESRMELAEIREKLTEALAKLPERERLTVSLYYLEGLRLREIGEVLELSESRVCRILAKAELTLRETMRVAGLTEPN